MKRGYRILALVLLLLGLLPAACLAADGQTLEEIMSQFQEDYGLNEQNFSLCYRDTTTGEEYRFNDTSFMVAASTFKLPLNLYYYELEQSGELSPESYVGGMRLADAHYQRLVWSNNDVSIAMLYNLGSFRTYKEKMRRYFTMEDEQITSAYYADNNYCTAMMLDALQYLYDRRDQFQEMLGYMEEAQPGEYFGRYVEDYPVAHKYGFFVDEDKGITAVNDVGIILTPQPFLLAVYTANVSDGAEVVARACELLTAYNVQQYEAARAAAEVEDAQKAEEAGRTDGITQADEIPQADGTEPVREGNQQKPETPAQPVEPAEAESSRPSVTQAPGEAVRENLWWMILVASLIFLTADIVLIFRLRHSGPEGFAHRQKKRGKSDEASEKTGVNGPKI